MTTKQLRKTLEHTLKTMSEDRPRPLYKWEEGYCEALRKALRHLEEIDGDTEHQRAKRHWTVAVNVYARLVAAAVSPEEIEGAVQTAIYAADRFAEEYEKAKEDEQ